MGPSHNKTTACLYNVDVDACAPMQHLEDALRAMESMQESDVTTNALDTGCKEQRS